MEWEKEEVKGYGDGDEVTELSFVQFWNKYATTYFRLSLILMR